MGNFRMAQIATVTFQGASGNKYDFTAYTTDTQFNEVGAVYIFTKEDNRSYIPLYIGQTDNLGERIPNHEKWSCVKQNGVNFSICAMVESSEFSRREIERDLLEMRNPPCNDRFFLGWVEREMSIPSQWQVPFRMPNIALS